MLYGLKGDYFNGQFHLAPTSGPRSSEVSLKRENPANTAETLWELGVCYDHVDEAIESARAGFRNWRARSQDERNNYLRAYQEQVMARKEEMAKAIALETGKPLWEAHTEVAAVIAKVNVTIEESLPRIANQDFPEILPHTHGAIYYKPLGPCLVIGPFNFPCHLANGQILSALISGNSIIFKPSEKTAYSAQIMFECFHAANFPAGVVNMVQGNAESARRLTSSKDIKGIYFTGSKEVGLKILQDTHKDLSKLVALELGGKNTSIIHEDANLEFTLSELLKACYLTTGQRCTSTALVAIHENIVDQFIERFHALAKRIIVDHPIIHDVAPFMGPLVDQKAMDTYLLFMGMAKREGIEEIMRGKHLDKKFPGHYVSPSIHLAKALDRNSHFLASEIFGPNVTFIPYKEFDEAIEIANSTEYGLASAVFTTQEELFKKAAFEIDSGLINWNRSTVGASSKLPFGGVKNSGNHRPAAVSTIDACVYPMASLHLGVEEQVDWSSVVGLRS